MSSSAAGMSFHTSSFSRPMRLAAVPLMRRSSVAGLCWNTRPRAREAGKFPEYQSDRNRRWVAPFHPIAAQSSSEIAQPMSSWQRR